MWRFATSYCRATPSASFAARRWGQQARTRKYSQAKRRKLKLLLVECYDEAGRERIASVGVRKASDIFASILKRLTPVEYNLELDFVAPVADRVS